jgi:HK97 family phage major capsid protein
MTATAEMIDVREELNAKTKALGEIFEAAKTEKGFDFTKVDGHGLEGDQKGRVERVQSLMEELKDLGSKAEEFQLLVQAEEHVKFLEQQLDGRARSNSQALHPAMGGGAPTKSIGEMFAQSDQIKAYAKGSGGDSQALELDLAKDIGGGNLFEGVKTLMTTSAGWAPEAIRSGRLVESAQRPLQVIDLIPGETTNQSSVVYMKETTFTNNAAEVAEGGTYGEAALALTEVTSPVRKIGVWLPVTDEQLEDVAQLQSYINNRLGFMVRQRLDGNILVGDGVAPNLDGINNRADVQTQALGADDVLTALYKARTKVRVVGRAVPNALFIHPNDLQGIALLQTADGIFIMGSPTGEGTVERIWGMRVVETDAQTENTALVGDTTMTGLAIKRNLTLQISNSHSTFFVEGKQAIRADLRAALQVYRDQAFCQVTGI